MKNKTAAAYKTKSLTFVSELKFTKSKNRYGFFLFLFAVAVSSSPI